METITFKKSQPRVVREFNSAEVKALRVKEWAYAVIRMSNDSSRKFAEVYNTNGEYFTIGFDSRDPHRAGDTIPAGLIRALVCDKAKYGIYLTTLSKWGRDGVEPHFGFGSPLNTPRVSWTLVPRVQAPLNTP